MADGKFKVNDVGIDTDQVSDSLRDSVPKVSKSYESNFGQEMDSGGVRPSGYSSSMESVGTQGYNPKVQSSHEGSSQLNQKKENLDKHGESELDKRENLEKNSREEKNEMTPMTNSQPVSSSPTGRSEQPHERPAGKGFQDESLPNDDALGEQGSKSDPSLGGADRGIESSDVGNAGNAGNVGNIGNLGNAGNQQAPLGNHSSKDLEKETDQEASPQDKKKEEKQRADENNANNIRNAAEVAKASGHPYAKAIGTAVSTADKFTNGKSSELLGKVMTGVNKMTPGGRRLQNASNKINESGIGDKAGQAAGAKNGNAGKGSKTASVPKKDVDAKKKTPGKKPDPKRAKSSKTAGAADGDPNRSESGSANLDGIVKAISNFFLMNPFALIVLVLILLLFLLFLGGNDFIAPKNGGSTHNIGNIDYGSYQLSSDGDGILNERLDKFLESKGSSLEAFNKLIQDNVQKNGYGTRAGVVAAAVTLIGELGDKYNVKIPYYLSGGHHDGVKLGALGYWGSNVEDNGQRCYYTGYGNVYTVCGLDCSGFVPWAIKNGGFQVGVRSAGDFQHMDGAQRVSLNSNSAVLQPGDLLESSEHVVLVVGVDENTKQYKCAEAAGKNDGVLFTHRPFSGGNGYWGVKMDGYYDKYSLKGK